MKSILNRRIKNRPRSHHAIGRRIRCTFFTNSSSVCCNPTFFTERLAYERDVLLTVRTPARPQFSAAATNWGEEQIQPTPGQSINAIRPGDVSHGTENFE